MLWPLTAIVTVSGFAGLGYEILWTRMLSLALGTEMMAVLGVVAGFFAGLALGAFVLDGPIRRARSPVRAYALLEAAIGLWALISIWLLPLASHIVLPLLGTEPRPALLWAASFALPALLLLPATAAMGGTLTALERLQAAVTNSTEQCAAVYAANTAGAVAGTLGAVLLLMPSLGLSGTLFALALLNAGCALAALCLPLPTEAPEPPTAAPPGTVSARLTITLFVTGFLGVGFEMVIVRLAAQVMQDTIYSFASLLAAYLLGIAAGGLAWQQVQRRAGGAAEAWLLVAASLACIGTAVIVPVVARAGEAAGTATGGEFAIAAVLFLVPSAVMGALFANLAQTVRDRRGSLGWAVGVNSVGAALAPLATAQLLIPLLGTWTALLPLGLGYLLLLPVRRPVLLGAAIPALLGISLWIRPPPSLIRVPADGRLLAVREGPAATASVVDDASGARYLEVNGHFRMGGTNSIRSDYRQAMLPLLLHPAPHDALFLGIGTGATLIGGAHLPGIAVRGVELLPEVVDLLPWFADPAAGTPRPPVTIADARRYIAADTGKHDVIIADLYHPALDGSSALYTVEHFAAIRARLAAGGVFCQWLPLYQLDLPSLRAIIRGFLDIYPTGSAWLAHYSVRTPMLALIGTEGGGRIDPAALAARLDDPATAAVARPLGFAAPIDLLGQYLGGPHTLAAFAGAGPRNTDDYPFVAFDAIRNVHALSAPPFAVLLATIEALQPDADELLAAPDGEALGPRLAAYWRARNRFLTAGTELRGRATGAGAGRGGGARIAGCRAAQRRFLPGLRSAHRHGAVIDRNRPRCRRPAAA